MFFLSSAPSQPPGKVMWNTSNSKIILNWEQVKALENESEVTGYKVSVQSLSFNPVSQQLVKQWQNIIYMYIDTNIQFFCDTQTFKLKYFKVSFMPAPLQDSGAQKLYCLFSFVILALNYNHYITQHLITRSYPFFKCLYFHFISTVNGPHQSGGRTAGLTARRRFPHCQF